VTAAAYPAAVAEVAISWRQACGLIGRPATETAAQALRLHVLRRVRDGAEDPRIPGRKNRQLTVSALLRCCPELRPSVDREAIRAVKVFLERAEERIREIAREEADLAVKRAQLPPKPRSNPIVSALYRNRGW
jgi:hypothetical protein